MPSEKASVAVTHGSCAEAPNPHGCTAGVRGLFGALLKPFEGGGSSTGSDVTSTRGQEGLLAGTQAAAGIDSFEEHVGAVPDVGSGSGTGRGARAGGAGGDVDVAGGGGSSRVRVREAVSRFCTSPQ